MLTESDKTSENRGSLEDIPTGSLCRSTAFSSVPVAPRWRVGFRIERATGSNPVNSTSQYLVKAIRRRFFEKGRPLSRP